MRFQRTCQGLQFLGCLIGMTCAVLQLQSQETPKKHFAPDETEIKKTETEIRVLYKADFAKKANAAQQALAEKLLQLGSESKIDSVEYFALMGMARDIAVQAGDLALAFSTIEELAKHYEIDPLLMKTNALTRGAKVSIPGANAMHLTGVAALSLQLVDSAVIGDQYETALRLGTIAKDCATRAKMSALATQAERRNHEIVETSKEYDRLKETLEKWNGKSDDPALNLTVGRFFCLMKGDWEKGLPVLAQAGEGELQKLAMLEAKNPEEPPGKIELADGWWELGEKRKRPAAHPICAVGPPIGTTRLLRRRPG